MGIVPRYHERLIEQALIQKLARVISGLTAVLVLLRAGLVQEQCVIQRTLDELDEDILFLALGAQQGMTPLHERYLAEFWQEEFDAPTAMNSTQKRGMVPRKKIRAYLASPAVTDDPSTANAAGHSIHKTYSGYVHAASPQIMDMVGGEPPRFHISGMQGTPRIEEHTEDAWNYFYRGLLMATVVGKALGDAQLVAGLYEYTGRFEQASGTNFLADAAR